jgi:hypothetical protein
LLAPNRFDRFTHCDEQQERHGAQEKPQRGAHSANRVVEHRVDGETGSATPRQRVVGFSQSVRQCGRLAPRLLECHASIETRDESVVVDGSAGKFARLDHGRDPCIEPCCWILEIRRHHADDGVHAAVEADLATDYGAIPPVPAPP